VVVRRKKGEVLIGKERNVATGQCTPESEKHGRKYMGVLHIATLLLRPCQLASSVCVVLVLQSIAARSALPWPFIAKIVARNITKIYIMYQKSGFQIIIAVLRSLVLWSPSLMNAPQLTGRESLLLA
jgi:hypothetical protein